MSFRFFDILQLVRFAFVGAATAAIFVVGVSSSEQAGLTSPGVTVASYLLAVAFQYVAHAKFTFRRRAASAAQLGRFVTVNAAGLVFSLLMLDVIAPNLGWSRGLVSLIVVLTLPVANFISFKLWAFATTEPDIDTNQAEHAMSHIYDDTFFTYIEQGSFRSAREVVLIMVEALSPASVVDVGCGRGAWAKVWGEEGVAEVHGVDGDYVDTEKLHISPSFFNKRDLANPFDLGRCFDLVATLEVAEHLPPDASAGFVESLVRHGDRVLFSAAPPGQGGERHINERPLEYWRARFAEHGYRPFDFLRPRIQRNERIEPWYRYNSVLYVHEDSVASLPDAVKSTAVPDGVALADLSPAAWRLRRAIVRLLPRPIVDWIAVTNAHRKAKNARDAA
ncbi:GtrA family protein [Maricaulaceae bacterium EIL42A08]|nr:GtrA family protein [Maricaulaceae bacterium EIL42A08]